MEAGKQVWLAFGVSTCIALGLLEGIKVLARKRVVDTALARKLTHILVGLVFIPCWALFPYDDEPDMSARVAALIPAGIVAKFAAMGLGIIDDPPTLAMLSRSGAKEELLYGPTQYGIIFVVTTWGAFRSPGSVCQLVLLCVGDGLADVVGRRLGSRKLPHSPDKSWAGSAAFVVGSYLAGIVYLYGCSSAGLGWYPLQKVHDWVFGWNWFVVCLLAGVVESLPLPAVDNVTVFATAYILCSAWGL
ncbi:phosphatidate cytidylyltransferase [Thecamonas trahens ATCC 50062]|uniref:phytol kinase n=1 Tax=Thecamonas trahens ATCC 50062 TaxID=461836 RepID=A0A0L0D7M9_THETB|nr:phosphatidate cytidylyltransferase [Thecamonas trahens ATCC 50062]KNC48364.1 phosphatidate cytidylyltransferase [Thecamonas trahens ATCC 50062]|eukprot:XP_013758484.1 phosphatidate cytidylyltransferase [Thecamonas trahens ATCC 50062]